MTIIINYKKYNTADDNALFVKVKRQITINFRNLFDRAIGPESVGNCARKGFPYYQKSSDFSLIIRRLDTPLVVSSEVA